MKSLKNKKGAIQDGLFVVLFLFVFAIFTLIGAFLVNTIKSEFSTSGIVNSDAQTIVNDAQTKFTPVFNYMFLTIMVGLMIATLVGAFLVRMYPWFYFITVTITAFFIAIGAVLSNAYNALASDPTFAAYATQLTIMDWVMLRIPIFTCVLSFLIMIMMYAKGGDL